MRPASGAPPPSVRLARGAPGGPLTNRGKPGATVTEVGEMWGIWSTSVTRMGEIATGVEQMWVGLFDSGHKWGETRVKP